MTQEFLNENKLLFKDCTREDQHILLDAVLDGKAEYFWIARDMWSKSDSRVPFPEVIYRTKPIKRLAIPWEHIKPEYKFARLTSGGRLFFYNSNPELKSPYRVCESSDALNIDTDGIDWRDSLVERPADK